MGSKLSPGSSNAAKALQVAPAVKALNDLTARIIALAHNRENPTRSDYAHPRFKEIAQLLTEYRKNSSDAR